MIKVTKLNGTTRTNTKWEIGKTVRIAKDLRNPKLCTKGVLHAYESVEQALVMKHTHNYESNNFKLFEVVGEVVVKDFDKVGCYELTPISLVEIPEWYKNQELRLKILVRFAAYVAMEVLPIFENNYPDDDRPRKAIINIMKYGTADFDKITYTAKAAADAAYAAANADAAYATVYAAYAAAHADAAYAAYAANAAYAAANTSNCSVINIIALMKRAIADFT